MGEIIFAILHLLVQETIKIVEDAVNNSNNDSTKIAIITYTQNNQAHIRNKLASHNLGYKVVVMGWFEFLLKHWITPFKTTLFPHLIDTHLGVSFVNENQDSNPIMRKYLPLIKRQLS